MHPWPSPDGPTRADESARTTRGRVGASRRDLGTLTPEECLVIYGEAWFERDAAKRVEVLRRCCTEDIVFMDPALGRLHGLEAVSEMIGGYIGSMSAAAPDDAPKASAASAAVVRAVASRSRWSHRSRSSTASSATASCGSMPDGSSVPAPTSARSPTTAACGSSPLARQRRLPRPLSAHAESERRSALQSNTSLDTGNAEPSSPRTRRAISGMTHAYTCVRRESTRRRNTARGDRRTQADILRPAGVLRRGRSTHGRPVGHACALDPATAVSSSKYGSSSWWLAPCSTTNSAAVPR